MRRMLDPLRRRHVLFLFHRRCAATGPARLVLLLGLAMVFVHSLVGIFERQAAKLVSHF